MGQETDKYHVTDDGNVYRVNKDGSFTEMGNAEEYQNHSNQESYQDLYDERSTKWRNWAVAILIILVLGAILYF